jgi:hypothetical protein
VINKTAPRKTEDELRDERARETLRQLAEVEAQIEAEKAKRAISGGHH